MCMSPCTATHDGMVCINRSRQRRMVFYAEGVAFQSPGSPRQRRTLGLHARGTKTPTGFYKRGMPRADRSCNANTAMNVGRLSNPVGVTMPRLALPGVRGVAANPGLWNVTPSAYVPYAILIGRRDVDVMNVHTDVHVNMQHAPRACMMEWYASTDRVNVELVFLRRRRCIPKPRVAAPAAHPGSPMPHGTETPTGFYKRGMPRTDRSCNTNTAMNVGRLSNPVGVTMPCLALPGVRGVAANPGLWNVTPSAYVPYAISIDRRDIMYRGGCMLPCTSVSHFPTLPGWRGVARTSGWRFSVIVGRLGQQVLLQIIGALDVAIGDAHGVAA